MLPEGPVGESTRQVTLHHEIRLLQVVHNATTVVFQERKYGGVLQTGLALSINVISVR